MVSGPANAGAFTLNPDGSFSYVPAANFHGTDSFEYQISDGNGGFDTATVNLIVQPVNDLPVALSDSFEVFLGEAPEPGLNVLLNDIEIDNNDTLIAILVSSPSNGTVTLNEDGSLIYIPDAGFIGTDSFTYVASDGVANIATTVEISVTSRGFAVLPNIPDGIEPDSNNFDSLDPGPQIESESVVESSTDINPRDAETDDDAELQGAALLTRGYQDDPFFDSDSQADTEGDTAELLLNSLVDRSQARTVLRAILESRAPIEEAQLSRLAELERSNSGIGAIFHPGFLYEEIGSQLDIEIGELEITLGAITTFGSIGYLLWTLRGGALIAFAMSQLPSWQMIDPLPVLDSYSGSGSKQVDDDEFGEFF